MGALLSTLSPDELKRLGDLLGYTKAAGGMNLEEADGFCTAQLCAIRALQPQEYIPQILGPQGENAFAGGPGEFAECVDLLMTHRAAKEAALAAGGAQAEAVPMFLPNSAGEVTGNDWAAGFMHSVSLDPDNWLPLLSDPENRSKLVAIMALAHENDPNPEMRTFEEPVTPEQREQLLAGVRESVPAIYAFMHAPETAGIVRPGNTVRRAAPKVGRNDPCPCGSGLKAKRCQCGAGA